MKYPEYKIKIEHKCEECHGVGEVMIISNEILTCSLCDGTGYQEELITLEAFKELLKGEENENH